MSSVFSAPLVTRSSSLRGTARPCVTAPSRVVIGRRAVSSQKARSQRPSCLLFPEFRARCSARPAACRRAGNGHASLRSSADSFLFARSRRLSPLRAARSQNRRSSSPTPRPAASPRPCRRRCRPRGCSRCLRAATARRTRSPRADAPQTAVQLGVTKATYNWRKTLMLAFLAARRVPTPAHA